MRRKLSQPDIIRINKLIAELEKRIDDLEDDFYEDED